MPPKKMFEGFATAAVTSAPTPFAEKRDTGPTAEGNPLSIMDRIGENSDLRPRLDQAVNGAGLPKEDESLYKETLSEDEWKELLVQLNDPAQIRVLTKTIAGISERYWNKQ